MIFYQVLCGEDSHNRRRARLDDDGVIFLHKLIEFYDITIKITVISQELGDSLSPSY